MTNVPLFPRGFLLSTHDVSMPPTYEPGPLLDNFYVHPWTQIETAGDSGLFVIVLGSCVSTSPCQVPGFVEAERLFSSQAAAAAGSRMS